MIKHLKLKFPPILNDLVLQDLGKLNVVCGKNNSGKSTLLESIRDKEKRVLGRRFNKEENDFIFDSSVSAEQWYGFSKAGRKQAYRALLEVVSTESEIWYENEKRLFIDKVAAGIKRNNILEGWSFPDAKVLEALDTLFRDDLKAGMLPPKRTLELQATIDTNVKPSTAGIGILNYLFYAASKFKGHELRVLFEKISDAFTRITDGYSFHISAEQNSAIRLSFSYRDKSWIYAEGCGLGLQDLLVILVLALLPDYQILLVEEPESHLHPEMQRKLLSFLKNETDKQYFISTHSNVFLNNAYIDRVFFTRFADAIQVDDATSRASILDDLGYSVAENLVADLVILVEGPNDFGVVEEFLVKMGLDQDYDIKIWPLGGDIMASLDLSVFTPNHSIIALIDNDPGSEKARKKFMKNCGAVGIRVTRLKRYAIENYFTLEALRQVFSIQIPDEITEIAGDIKLEEQIGMNVKGANRRVARAMSIDEIKGTDLFDFFMEVQKLCKGI
jgi:AAA domain, putative AbiEii toxin, Type IV TA system